MTKVKSGDEISLGTKILQLLEAFMLHWPDSMFTYVKEDQLLLPNGGFGQFLPAISASMTNFPPNYSPPASYLIEWGRS